jgi:type II restriction/modification system DNA methylase subunit YeeA
VTPAEFKKKWGRFAGKETSGYVEHFNDLCRLLGQPTPAEADPSASEFFCFQKRVVKDAELFPIETDFVGQTDDTERGFADVWKKGCFAWEYKGKKKNLDEAYRQLLRYRESLLNPPLLAVCDFDRFIIRTNFNGTVQEVHEFTNDQIDDPDNLKILRALFEDPDYLKPQRTTAQVTEDLAEQIAEVARSLQNRESVELADAKNRKEVGVAQRKNLRIARFLNRIVFCLFAEDTGLLPKGQFAEVAKVGLEDPHIFAESLGELFRVMAKGGRFGTKAIRHFNGHLFEEATVFELTEKEIARLAEAAEADWQFIQPGILGTLFERALDENQRSQSGAHYTGEADIKSLVEPVLMEPFRREWSEIKGELAAACAKGKVTAVIRERLSKFQNKVSTLSVLDPACGSGNFLYVSLQSLLGLEKEIISFASQLGFSLKPQVSVQQLKAIEINPYAYELAQVSVQIGYLQWRRDNGYDNDRTPVLQNLDGFENKDALLHETFRKKPKNLKAARDEEHQRQDNLFKVYLEREWPAADVIVGNPPFLGDKLMRGELGDEYVEELRRIYSNRIPGQSDLCCYWFEKTRDLIEHGKCRRAGLLATQGIRGGANREVLKRIKETGDIFFAVSDREWILAGANVHVSMVGFDDGVETHRRLNGQTVKVINSNLTSIADFASAAVLEARCDVAFIGTTKGGNFDISEKESLALLHAGGNPNGKPNSDVLKPILNGFDILRRKPQRWIIDNETKNLADAASYEAPLQVVVERVKPHRDNNRNKWLKENWWRLQRFRPEMRAALLPLTRFIATPRVSKHRICSWFVWPIITDDQTVVFAREDDFFFGIVHSRIHEVWALGQGTQVREKESGFRYTPTTCFDTFPFPFPDDLKAPPVPEPAPKPKLPEPDPAHAEALAAKYYFMVKDEAPPYSGSPKTPDQHRAAIAAAAKELNELRERWLNPPEWTETRILEFPGTAGGPWDRYLDPNTLNSKTGIGTVRYPRLEPRDADCAAKLKKRTLTNLYNQRPAWLDLAHKKIDAAVADAYGWPANLSDEQILERLLALNLQRAAEEKKKPVQPAKSRTSRAKQADELI